MISTNRLYLPSPSHSFPKANYSKIHSFQTLVFYYLFCSVGTIVITDERLESIRQYIKSRLNVEWRKIFNCVLRSERYRWSGFERSDWIDFLTYTHYPTRHDKITKSVFCCGRKDHGQFTWCWDWLPITSRCCLTLIRVISVKTWSKTITTNLIDNFIMVFRSNYENGWNCN